MSHQKQNHKKTVALIAPTGMLGSAVYNELRDKYQLILIYRDEDKLKLLDQAFGKTQEHRQVKFDLFDLYQDYLSGFKDTVYGPKTQELKKLLEPADFVINCAGIIKPYSTVDPIETFFINGAIPHILSSFKKEKLIQITTDCAFDGLEGAPYNENSPKTPVDLYGLSKVIGEPSSSLVLRTSIIGSELHGFVSLLEWLKKQNNETVKGFKNHFWNGITAKQFGKVCHQLITNPQLIPGAGTYHIFSTTVSKYEMLLKFKEKYNINCEILTNEEQKLNRTLSTVKDLNKKLNIPSFDEMLAEL